MPAYNAASTPRQTYDEVMAQNVVDLVIVVDDASRDQTTAVARHLPNTVVHTHADNRGYGGNQKTCYRLALEAGADIIVMVHPDYQYTPKLIPAMVSMIGNDLYFLCDRFQDIGRLCPERRHAHLEIYRQPLLDFRREHSSRREAF
jgi:glycosyltransferase involved in cell wall biosynthesis